MAQEQSNRPMRAQYHITLTNERSVHYAWWHIIGSPEQNVGVVSGWLGPEGIVHNSEIFQLCSYLNGYLSEWESVSREV